MILRDKIFYTTILSFLAAVGIASLVNVGIYLSAFFILLGLLLFLVKYILEIDDVWAVLFITVLLSCGVGLLRVEVNQFFKNTSALDKHVGTEFVFEGVILDEPKVKEKNTQLRVYLEGENVGILVFADTYPQFQYGDKIKVRGKLQKPENFETDTGRIFDYVSYLDKDNIFYQIFYPEIELIDSGGGNFVKRWMFGLKNAFLSSVKQVVPEPHSALLGGITVGAEESLGAELEDDFRKTGIIHIVVLSGYNITIVAEFFMRIFAWLPLLWKSLIGGLSILLFMIMTGATATIVRASLMAVLVIIARITGRTTDILRLLLVAGFLMVIQNPSILIFDPSFQLSFLATLGLIYLAPFIEKYLGFMPSRFELREFATATIATQIFVLPLLLYMTGEISLVSIPVNLLVLPVIPVSMFLGLFTGVFGWISSALAFPIGFLNFVLLDYVLKVVDFFSSLSFASVFVGGFSVWVMVSVYLVYVFGVWMLHKRKKLKESK